MNYLRFDCGRANCGSGMLRLALRYPKRARCLEGESLRLIAPVDHYLAHRFDRVCIGSVEEQHRCPRACTEPAMTLAAQKISHCNRHIAEINIDRTGVRTFVTHRAM